MISLIRLQKTKNISLNTVLNTNRMINNSSNKQITVHVRPQRQFGYWTCAWVYSGKNAYIDGDKMLTKYKKNKCENGIYIHDGNVMDSELSAASTGAFMNTWSHFWCGVFWPIQIIYYDVPEYIPKMVVKYNKEESVNDTKQK